MIPPAMRIRERGISVQYFMKKLRFLMSGEGGNSTKQLLQGAPIILGQFWGPKMFAEKGPKKSLK